jgi:hypothetical protein
MSIAKSVALGFRGLSNQDLPTSGDKICILIYNTSYADQVVRIFGKFTEVTGSTWKIEGLEPNKVPYEIINNPNGSEDTNDLPATVFIDENDISQWKPLNNPVQDAFGGKTLDESLPDIDDNIEILSMQPDGEYDKYYGKFVGMDYDDIHDPVQNLTHRVNLFGIENIQHVHYSVDNVGEPSTAQFNPIETIGVPFIDRWKLTASTVGGKKSKRNKKRKTKTKTKTKRRK